MTDTEVMYKAVKRAVVLNRYDDDERIAWLALADAHEDAGEMALAEAVRWMVANEKRPMPRDGLMGWVWFLSLPQDGTSGRFDRYSDLPEELIRLLRGSRDGEITGRYETLESAVAHLAAAIAEWRLNFAKGGEE